MDPILSERVRTSRLLGADPSFVLHGGGNTSAKGEVRDLLGRRREVIWIKGSGWDLATIEAAGLPALDLAALRELRALDALSDEDMVRELRRCLLDPSAPTPSVESLLHAFLPHRFIDHSHADAILALSNCEQGEARCRDLFGDRLAYLPFLMPGFPLAKAVAEAVEAQPEVEGVLLHQHGLFSFGDSGEESLARHREFVAMAATCYEDARQQQLAASANPSVTVGEWLPRLRGKLCVEGEGGSRILASRRAPWLLAALAEEGARERLLTPPLTPDHALRTKALPCWLEALHEEAIDEALARFTAAYRAYFEAGVAARGERQMLDPLPRVLLVPGYGLIGVGDSPKAAAMAADLAEHTVLTKMAARSLGPYRGLSELELFDMEYWSLEQAKLGKRRPAELAGQVAVVTGGGGAIGEGVARVLQEAGATVALLDLRQEAAEAAAARLGGSSFAVSADVSSRPSLEAALKEVCQRCGGFDILVANAGIAHVAPLEQLEEEDWQRVVAVNQTGVLHSLQLGGQLLRAQGRGGAIVLMSSKNVLAPGASFGAYSATKAGAHQLAKVAAMEFAADDIRVNMVCPDAVFRHGDQPSGLWATVGPDRARSRGLKPEALEAYYRERNLLHADISAEAVGRAVLFFAARRTPTTGATLPVDGGVPAAFPR